MKAFEKTSQERNCFFFQNEMCALKRQITRESCLMGNSESVLGFLEHDLLWNRINVLSVFLDVTHIQKWESYVIYVNSVSGVSDYESMTVKWKWCWHSTLHLLTTPPPPPPLHLTVNLTSLTGSDASVEGAGICIHTCSVVKLTFHFES